MRFTTGIRSTIESRRFEFRFYEILKRKFRLFWALKSGRIDLKWGLKIELISWPKLPQKFESGPNSWYWCQKTFRKWFLERTKIVIFREFSEILTGWLDFQKKSKILWRKKYFSVQKIETSKNDFASIEDRIFFMIKKISGSGDELDL